MNNNQTLEKMRSLRLFGMHDAFKTSLETSIKEQMTQDQFVAHLICSEFDNCRNHAIKRAIKAAQFRYNASIEEMDYTLNAVWIAIRPSNSHRWNLSARAKTCSSLARRGRGKAIWQRRSATKLARRVSGSTTQAPRG